MSSTLRPVIIKHTLPALVLCLLVFGAVSAQNTSFTYQGRLTDAGALANGAYDIEFKLFDNADGQQGPTLTNEDVTVLDGSFVVVLDFGDVFDGTERFLEIGVRPGDSVDEFTVLNPRWPITSTPYAIRSLKAGTADTATNATTADTATTATNATTADTATDATQLGGVAADQYVKTDDPRLGGEGGNFIQNGADPQAANFNITGTGIAGGIGIGQAPRPGFALDVIGTALVTPNAGAIQLGTPNFETGITISRTNRADLRFDGSTLKLVAGLPGGPPPATNGIVINTAGSVGIGTAAPTAGIRLDVTGDTLIRTSGSGGNIQFGTPAAETGMTVIGTNRADVRFDGATLKLIAGLGRGVPPVSNGIAINAQTGNVGIGVSFPTSKLEIAAQNGLAITGFQPFLTLRDTNGGNRSGFVQGVNGDVLLLTNSRAALVVKDVTGMVSVRTLQIVGGGDLSENFDVNVAKATGSDAVTGKVEAGMVVSIDSTTPGKLALTTRAYDRRVAGIISGAGGVQTGMMMSHEGTLADGKEPVALSGRVYAWVDATRGSVKPGDLLTTSATPGHAMKVRNRAKAQGAILGKAMTGLKQGKGLVLVLVTLQ